MVKSYDESISVPFILTNTLKIDGYPLEFEFELL
jgi:hypothetical protein